jgi:hypothetical protein
VQNRRGRDLEANVPIIAYQSFNANSSHDHGLKALSHQTFTQAANAHMAQHQHQALVLPHDPNNMTKIYYGPAEKKTPVDLKTFQTQNTDYFMSYVEQFRQEYDIDKPASEIIKDPFVMQKMQEYMISQTVGVFGGQISAVWANFARTLNAVPDVMVCGEIDASHPDLADAFSDPSITVKVASAQKACQCFSVVSQTALASKIMHISEDVGYVACRISDINVLFVHVPNAMCKKREEMEQWYFKIANNFKSNGQTLDLVIGDTNQGSSDFTRQVLDAAFNVPYQNALGSDKQISKIDSVIASSTGTGNVYNNVVESGTNAGGTAMFDVAVFNSQTIKCNKLVYVSQAATGVTITDHSGLGVDVERI